MAEPTGLDALEAGFRADHGPPVEEKVALTVAPEDMSARQLFRSVEILRAEVEQRVPIGDVDRFLRRERDEYEPRGECWNTVDDVLDAFRLHVITSTPLTLPRPEGGPESLGVGPEPLTEAEELRREVARLTEERDQAIAHDRQPYPTQWAYDHACEALDKHRQRADKAERALDEVMKERDDYHELLDRFALAVAPVEVIGEHSSANDPWANALEVVTPAAEVERLRTEREGWKAAADQTAQALAEVNRQRGEAQDRANAAEAELANAKAVMSKALAEVEHEEVVYLLNRYLSARPSTTEEGEQ